MATMNQVQRFLDHLRDDLARSPSTIAGYRDELTALVRRQIPLTRPSVRRFVNDRLDGRPLAPQARNRRLAIVRAFVRYLRKNWELVGNPVTGLKRSRVPKQEPVATTHGELLHALAALSRRPPSWRRTRDGTVLVLLFYTALRVSELCRLDLAQVDLAVAALRRVVRKGGKVMDIQLHPTALAALALYLPVRSTRAQGESLLVTKYGKRPSVRSIQKLIASIAKDAGLSHRLHPHALRHACATELAALSVGSGLIQRHLAHDSLQTTERYIHVLPAPVRSAIERLPKLPLDALTPPRGRR
jgi:site-specific recombinase XerC